MKNLMLAFLFVMLFGCTQANQMLVSPNFIEEHLPRILEVEKSQEALEIMYGIAVGFGVPLGPIIKDIQILHDLYYFYLEASYTHLASGNLELLAQTTALAELQIQKAKDLIEGQMNKQYDVPKPMSNEKTI